MIKVLSTMDNIRKIKVSLKSRPTFEGAGVRLKRAFGYADPSLDPFLLLDDFHSDNPNDYIKGFPWHPHRGIETITYMLHGKVEHGDSLGNGGIFGRGLDNSTQKLEFLPEPFTDFIFAIVGEEFGFLGTMILLTLFLLIVLEGYRIAHNCRDEAGAILATGITTSLALYAFLNAGVVCNLFPTKGLPMPFISYGGSFMLTSLAGIGILLNISQHNEFRLSDQKRKVYAPNRSEKNRKKRR